MANGSNCPICNQPATVLPVEGRDALAVDCSHCKQFQISRTARNATGWHAEVSMLDLSKALALLAEAGRPAFIDTRNAIMAIRDANVLQAQQKK